MRHRFARIIGVAALTTLAACASTGGGVGQGPVAAQQDSIPATMWPVRTFHHVDLWLHGFAMIQDDTTLVPFFRRGYKAELTDLKRRANVSTQLDANLATL